jgi:hypothetical protein
MRRNADETQRDLERKARDGDHRAALRLLAEWQRTGEVTLVPQQIRAELQHDTLGRVELVFTFPVADAVKRDVTYDMTFFDIRSGRARGLVVIGNGGSVDDLAFMLASYGSLARSAANITDVVANTKRRGAISLESIVWPVGFESDQGGYYRASDKAHEGVRAVLDEFWSDPSYRATLIEVLMKARLAYRASRLDEMRRRFDQVEENTAQAVDEELLRRAGKLDFYPPVEDEDE